MKVMVYLFITIGVSFFFTVIFSKFCYTSKYRSDRVTDTSKLCIEKIENKIYTKKVPSNSFVDYDEIIESDTNNYLEFLS